MVRTWSWRPLDEPLLTLIPPAMFGPPEKVSVDEVATDDSGPGVDEPRAGKIGVRAVDVGGLYYRHSSPGHAGLMADVVDRLLPAGRQLKTSAHRLVEITLMRQPERQRPLVHFVNLCGHGDTAYFEPVTMRDITVELAGDFARARAVGLGETARGHTLGRARPLHPAEAGSVRGRGAWSRGRSPAAPAPQAMPSCFWISSSGTPLVSGMTNSTQTAAGPSSRRKRRRHGRPRPRRSSGTSRR